MSDPVGQRPPRRSGGSRQRRWKVLALVMWMVSMVCLSACVERPAILVFAAASLSDALTDAGQRFEEETGLAVDFNFAGSNVLARQIEAGAPADLFVSADLAQIQILEAAGRVEPGRVMELVRNRLAVIVPDGVVGEGTAAQRWSGVEDLLAYDRLALADPTAVPAGVYARQWLESHGLWERLEDRVVPGVNVRASLAAVAAGDVPVGIVYVTDVASSRRVRALHVVPDADSPRICYYLALLSDDPEVSLLTAFLRGPEAREEFRRRGFVPPTDGP